MADLLSRLRALPKNIRVAVVGVGNIGRGIVYQVDTTPGMECVDPAQHYLLHGGLEGRDPGPAFSSEWYITNYPEIAEKHINPLVYFCQFIDKKPGG